MNYKYSLESIGAVPYISWQMSGQLLVELSDGRQRNIYSDNVVDVIVSPDPRREASKIILRQDITGGVRKSESLEQIEISDDTNITSIIDWWESNKNRLR